MAERKARVSSKVIRPPKYDIAYAGGGIQPVLLGRLEKDEIRRTLKCQPSVEFISAYSIILADYIAHRAVIARSTPAAVHKRLKTLLRDVKAVQRSLSALELADEMLLSRFVRKRLLKNEPYTGSGTLSEAVSGFLPINDEAVAVFEKGENRGRPPAYADQALAKVLCTILSDETGKRPTTRRDGMFARLLQNAFNHASKLSNFSDDVRIPKPRKNVDELMRLALQDPHQPLLPCFKSVDKQGPEEKIVSE